MSTKNIYLIMSSFLIFGYLFMISHCAEAGPGWQNCTWVPVGARKSHQPGVAWCPDGSFLTQLDLDSDGRLDGHDSPIVGQARCCQIAGIPAAWKDCAWIRVGARMSHQRGAEWCPQGSFLTQLDLDGDKKYSARDTPYVGQARCCRPADNNITGWSSSSWVNVGGPKSHQPNQAWCSDGSFLTRIDLDGDKRFSDHDAPIVGAALCSSPEISSGKTAMMQALPMATLPTAGVLAGTLQMQEADIKPLAPPAGNSADSVDLKIMNLTITPQPEGGNGSRITLHTYRSYQIQATVQRGGTGQPVNFPGFTVRTVCIRNGTSSTLGEGRVGVTSGSAWTLYATYDIFPSSAGAGPCLLRTMVDADNNVPESDESTVSNVWERQVLIAQ